MNLEDKLREILKQLRNEAIYLERIDVAPYNKQILSLFLSELPSVGFTTLRKSKYAEGRVDGYNQCLKDIKERWGK